MFYLIIKSFLLSALFVMVPLFATADEVTDVVNDVAAKLVQQLPMDKKIALKSLSPDETGLPEDFLRKLTSDLEAALLTASDFEINLANRATMEDVWQEAVEFNNADFDELFKSANADVMLMMSPRAISKGVEIAITAYSLTGDDVGKTLASSGSILLPIDLQANLGVDINDLNKQMAQVLAEIEKVGQTGGLISNPNTYAEFYHNARLLQQRGEVDLAMRNYESAIKEPFDFIDPMIDLAELAITRYGTEAAQRYLEKRILPEVTTNKALFIKFVFLFSEAQKQSLDFEDLDKSPLLSIAVAMNYESSTQDNWNYGSAKMSILWRHAFDNISRKGSSFSFEKYFIDDLRAYSLFESSRKVMKRINEDDPSRIGWGKPHFFGITQSGLVFFDKSRFYYVIYEKIDFSQPPEWCSVYMGGLETCLKFRRDVRYKDWYQSEVLSRANIGCNMTVKYYSAAGVLTETPLIIERAEFLPESNRGCNKYLIRS